MEHAENENTETPPAVEAQPATPGLEHEREQQRIDAERRALNDSAQLVDAQTLLRDYFPELPGISKEYIPESRPFVVDDSKPLRVDSVLAGRGGAGNVADSPLPDDPRDSQGNIFNPRKHWLDDSGEPDTTAKGRYRPLGKRALAQGVGEKQAAIWLARRTREGAEGADEATDEAGSRDRHIDPDEAEKEAGLWVDFMEMLASLFCGDEGKMRDLPNGQSEKELINRGVTEAFTKWRVIRFPAFVALFLGAFAWGARMAKAKGPQNRTERSDPVHRPKEAEIIELNEPKKASGGDPFAQIG